MIWDVALGIVLGAAIIVVLPGAIYFIICILLPALVDSMGNSVKSGSDQKKQSEDDEKAS